MNTKQTPKAETEITKEVRELIEYLVCYFQEDSIAHKDGNGIAYSILDGAVGRAARELRLRGELSTSLMLQRNPPAAGSDAGTPHFSFHGLADALENARGIALMAQVVHDKLNVPSPKGVDAKATEAKSEAA
jgi:hypothetical protein